jgi:tight adherence protein B
MDQLTLLLMGVAMLGALAVGGVVFAFAGAGAEGKAKKRMEAVAGSGGKAKGRSLRDIAVDNTAQRRKQVQDTLKELEKKQEEQKKSRLTLRGRIEQAGLEIEVKTFIIWSVAAGIGATIFGLITSQPIYIVPLMGLAGGLGLPRWLLGFLKNRRQKAFLLEFANAIDIIVRGVKAGLPLNDCLKVIASESPDPVGPEFNTLVEGQKVGVPLEQGLRRMYERMPLPEVNFFAIVLTIQQKTGGNLSEALGNLALVLRDRKRMKGKIQAMSSEAKASAAIIGSLPFAVMMLVYLSSPSYIMLLFSEKLGNFMLLGSGLWMSCGILVMKKMINFKF